MQCLGYPSNIILDTKADVETHRLLLSAITHRLLLSAMQIPCIIKGWLRSRFVGTVFV